MTKKQIQINSDKARKAYMKLWGINKNIANDVAAGIIYDIINNKSGQHIFHITGDENHYYIAYYPYTNKVEFGIEEKI